MTFALNHDSARALLERKPLRRVLALLNGDGEETRIVGGAVRNALLDRAVVEVDLATTATPDIVESRAKRAGLKTVPTGIDHGTVTVLCEGEPFEVTTLREDVETDGRRAIVHFGRDFAADALRRDFTINALSLSLDESIHDYTGGIADLEARRVRFIGNARTRIREDYLRILRFFRFYAEYGQSEPDAEGLTASGDERAGLAILSRERIRHELMKILVARRSQETIRILAEHGFLTGLLGGAAEFGRFERVCAESNTGSTSRLAALGVMVPEDAERLRERLRLSNDEHGFLETYGNLVGILKSLAAPLDALAIRRLVAQNGLADLSYALTALAGEPQPVLLEDAREALERFRDGSEAVPVFPLRGSDLLERGIQPGPRIGHVLARAREAWLDDGCPPGEAAALAFLQRALAEI